MRLSTSLARNNNMTIVITKPTFFDGEAEQIAQLLHRGDVDLIHIRKPESSETEVEALLQQIPQSLHSRIVLHDHHQLAVKHKLYGVHLNSRNPLPPVGWKGSVSRSCHSLDELTEWKGRCNYLSLSPIFDSISKQGYCSAFTKEEIEEAHKQGIINGKVLALGGVTFSKLSEVKRLGFGGGMILGDAWQKPMPIVLSIAGSDPSAGAGVQQDLKTMTAIGVYGATVITALTSQNTLGVQAVMAVPSAVVQSQLASVLADLEVSAIKIGQVPDAEVAHAIADALRKLSESGSCPPVIYDPVMISTSGRRLMTPDTIAVIEKELIPLCTLLTPNIPEASQLVGRSLDNEDDVTAAGKELSRRYGNSILIKGGHSEGDDMNDRLFLQDDTVRDYHTPRITTTNLHGTGCTLSSAIASYIAKGNALPTAVQLAKDFVTRAIEGGAKMRVGHGNGPLDVITIK